MTSGVSGFSSVLIWNFKKVLEALSLSGPSETMDPIELTNHDSPNTYREFVHGMFTGGEIAVEGNFIKEDALGQIALHTDMQAGNKKNVFIVMPMAVGGALFFAAHAKGFELSYPFDSKIGVSGSLAVTGKPLLLVTQSGGLSTPFLEGKETNDVGDPLTILPELGDRAADTYAYTCTVGSTIGAVVLTVTAEVATSHIVYVQGVLEDEGVETPVPLTLGVGGTTTDILIIVHEGTAAIPTKAPRLYTLSVKRLA